MAVRYRCVPSSMMSRGHPHRKLLKADSQDVSVSPVWKKAFWRASSIPGGF